MPTLLSVTTALSDLPFGAQLLVLLALVTVTALGLNNEGRKLTGRYSLVGLAILISVALVMGVQRGYGTENQPPQTQTSVDSAAYVPGLVFERYCINTQDNGASLWSPPCSLTLFR